MKEHNHLYRRICLSILKNCLIAGILPIFVSLRHSRHSPALSSSYGNLQVTYKLYLETRPPRVMAFLMTDAPAAVTQTVQSAYLMTL